MLLTHDDALGIRLDAIANFNLGTKRHYSRVNPVSLVRNSFVYRNHAKILYQHQRQPSEYRPATLSVAFRALKLAWALTAALLTTGGHQVLQGPQGAAQPMTKLCISGNTKRLCKTQVWRLFLAKETHSKLSRLN